MSSSTLRVRRPPVARAHAPQLTIFTSCSPTQGGTARCGGGLMDLVNTHTSGLPSHRVQLSIGAPVDLLGTSHGFKQSSSAPLVLLVPCCMCDFIVHTFGRHRISCARQDARANQPRRRLVKFAERARLFLYASPPCLISYDLIKFRLPTPSLCPAPPRQDASLPAHGRLGALARVSGSRRARRRL